ncbi:hypothetical protein GQR58_025793 [Nymphon striatum]|nr:hypothetical protein GQR58_025793 [Nymphon striatum]
MPTESRVPMCKNREVATYQFIRSLGHIDVIDAARDVIDAARDVIDAARDVIDAARDVIDAVRDVIPVASKTREANAIKKRFYRNQSSFLKNVAEESGVVAVWKDVISTRLPCFRELRAYTTQPPVLSLVISKMPDRNLMTTVLYSVRMCMILNVLWSCSDQVPFISVMKLLSEMAIYKNLTFNNDVKQWERIKRGPWEQSNSQVAPDTMDSKCFPAFGIAGTGGTGDESNPVVWGPHRF